MCVRGASRHLCTCLRSLVSWFSEASSEQVGADWRKQVGDDGVDGPVGLTSRVVSYIRQEKPFVKTYGAISDRFLIREGDLSARVEYARQHLTRKRRLRGLLPPRGSSRTPNRQP